jgi:hypothetical protein
VLGVAFFALMRRLGQLELVIVVSYVTLFMVVGGLMLKESIREFWSKRRGAVKPLRRAGEHPAYLGWPWRMRFPRSNSTPASSRSSGSRCSSASPARCSASAAASSWCRRCSTSSACRPRW